MTNASEALDALGDPSRRQLLELLRPGELTVRELTDAMTVSQSAVSQHLRVLRDARLVDVRAVGTRRLYRVDLDGLATVRGYVDRFWDGVLDAFVTFADDQPTTAEEPSDDHRPRPARRPRPPAGG